jgi:hypothetical protein
VLGPKKDMQAAALTYRLYVLLSGCSQHLSKLGAHVTMLDMALLCIYCSSAWSDDYLTTSGTGF